MTQKDFVIKKLKDDGYISRNYCLQNFISRLGAIACDLKNDGWELEGKNKDGDYIYEVKVSPFKREYYRLEDGRIISRLVCK